MRVVNKPIQNPVGHRTCRWAAAVLVPLLWSGCLAQKADVTRMNQELDRKIAKLDEAIKRANEAEAKLGQDVSELRGEEVASIQGELEKRAHDVATLSKRLDDLEQVAKHQASAQKADRERLQQQLEKLNASLETLSAAVVTSTKALEGRLQEQDKAIAAEDAQRQALGAQVAQLGRALAEFKLTIGGLGEKLIQEDQRINDFTVEASRRTDALTDKVEADAKTTTAHLAEVNKSVASVARALEAVGAKFVAQEGQQDRRMDEMAKSLQAVNSQVAALTRAVNQMGETVQAAQAIHSQVDALARAVAELREGRGPASKPGGKKTGQTVGEIKDHRAAKQTDRPPGHDAVSPGGEAAASAPAPPTPAEPTAPAELGQGEAGEAAQAGSRGDAQTTAVGTQARTATGAKEAYERTIEQFKQGNLNGALQGFSDFLTQHPTSELAPNAQYWLGECYYGKKEYERAIEAFDRVKAAYPTSEKVPAALLKKGFAYLALKDRGRASSVLRQVVDAYPKSPEAGKALDKLAQLKQTR